MVVTARCALHTYTGKYENEEETRLGKMSLWLSVAININVSEICFNGLVL